LLNKTYQLEVVGKRKTFSGFDASKEHWNNCLIHFERLLYKKFVKRICKKLAVVSETF